MIAEYIDHMGTDLSVVNAAKVSFARKSNFLVKEFDKKYDAVEFAKEVNGYVHDGPQFRVEYLAEGDRRLIGFLARGCPLDEWNNIVYNLSQTSDSDFIESTVKDLMGMAKHWTTFSHTAISLRIGAPVPIRTQAFKHKQGFTENEESRRYISGRPEFYIPDDFRSKPTGNVKQGSGGVHYASEQWKERYINSVTSAIDLYEEMISDGVSAEQARFVLPQGVIVNWVWTGNLSSYSRFYNQRTDPHAQKESQILAEKIGSIIEPLFPVSWKELTT